MPNKLFLKQLSLKLEADGYGSHEKDFWTWEGAAHQAGDPVRAGTSGTAALTISGLLALAPKTLGTDPKKAKKFFNLCLLPTFLFGDYHTIPETQAGLDHDRAERQKTRGETPKRDRVVGPTEALCRGVKSMVKTIDVEYQTEANRLADKIYRKAVPDRYQDLKSQVSPPGKGAFDYKH